MRDYKGYSAIFIDRLQSYERSSQFSRVQYWSWDALLFFFSSRRRHTRSLRDWSSDVCSSDLRGKGLSKRSVTWKHLFLGALVPVTTMSGIQLGYLLGGTVVVEQIFVLPGLGRLLITSINNRDFPVVQSVILIFAAGFVVVNMLTDVLYTVIDPRTRA